MYESRGEAGVFASMLRRFSMPICHDTDIGEAVSSMGMSSEKLFSDVGLTHGSDSLVIE